MTTIDVPSPPPNAPDATPAPAPPTPDEQADVGAQVEAFAEQLFGATIAGMELLAIDVGTRLGLYDALHEAGPVTPGDLAERTGIDERYALEWLEQQAVAGVVAIAAEPLDGDRGHRRFVLPPAHAEVLVNRDSLAYFGPFARFLVGAAKSNDLVVEAYRTGEGVSFGAYGDEIRTSLSAVNRPHYLGLIGSTWFPGMPDVVARLESDPPALVADVGCGTGWSTIAIALAYPKVRVHGIDLDEASIADARRNAEIEGVADRVTFEVRNAADAAPGAYDLVCMFEALHDTARPRDVLAALRSMAGPDGTVFVADELSPDEFEAPGDPLARFQHVASTLHCLLVGRSEEHNHATGTVLRTAELRRLASEAGFAHIDVLPVENDFFRFYRLGG